MTSTIFYVYSSQDKYRDTSTAWRSNCPVSGATKNTKSSRITSGRRSRTPASSVAMATESLESITRLGRPPTAYLTLSNVSATTQARTSVLCIRTPQFSCTWDGVNDSHQLNLQRACKKHAGKRKRVITRIRIWLKLFMLFSLLHLKNIYEGTL